MFLTQKKNRKTKEEGRIGYFMNKKTPRYFIEDIVSTLTQGGGELKRQIKEKGYIR
jgi:hypothetical protein